MKIAGVFITVVVWLFWTFPALAQGPVVITSTNEAGEGLIFTAPGLLGTPVQQILITDDSGQIVFSQDEPGFDFKRQGDVLTYFDTETSEFVALDQNYQLVKTWYAVGPDPADLHEFRLLPNGHALFLVYRPRVYDMSLIVPGGLPTATVISCVVQEVDQDNNLAFEWDGWGYNPITHSISLLTASRIDYDHCNGAEQDSDGNILVSHRNLNQVTKINRQTGAVLWKLGGVANEFTFTNDAGFALQHDIRRLPDGHITLFDDGTVTRGYSRAVEFEIDEVAKVITRTWEYTGPFAYCCGNAQRLPNGNTFINWGPAHPSITEVTPDGRIVFAADMAFSYRSFRFPWWRRHWLPLVGK